MTEVISKLYANEAPEARCRCGAVKRIVHCPACGSTNFYAKGSASLTLPVSPDGTLEPITLRGFRCRRCTVDFYEGQPCEAPFFETETMKKRREMDEATARAKEAYDTEFIAALQRGETKEDARRSALQVLLKITTGAAK